MDDAFAGQATSLCSKEIARQMNAHKNQYPRTVDEAVERLHVNMSLNEEILLASTNEKNLIDLSLKTTDIVSGGAWGRRPHTFSEPTLLVNKI